MIIEPTKIAGVNVLLSEPFKDERGFFNRVFCQNELKAIKPQITICQVNHSMTQKKGTVRGMHFQYQPYSEMKIVRCLKGSIFDVAVDLRKNSPTLLQWHGEILSADNMKALVIPEGCAHGFQSLEDTVEMLYIHTNYYCKSAEGAVKYNDPLLNIEWPLEITDISQKDLTHPFLDNAFAGVEV